MPDIADYDYERLYEDVYDLDQYPDHLSDPRCRQCNSTKVYWGKSVNGKWMLMQMKGNRMTQQKHRCPVDLKAFPDLSQE